MRRDLISKLAIATLLVLAAPSFAGAFLMFRGYFWGALTGNPLGDIAVYGIPLGLVVTGVLVFSKPRLGYALGGIIALIAILWLIRFEWSPYESYAVVFNAQPDLTTDDLVQKGLAFAEPIATLRIVFAALITPAAAACLLRLLPAPWSLGGLPISQRIWPAFAVGMLVMGTWFLHAAMPYRVPLIVDGVSAELRILHVEKRGLHLEETAEILYRHGRSYLRKTQRQLFHYQWQTQGAVDVVTKPLYDRATALVDSPELKSLQPAPADHLWSWNAEGWYVVLQDDQLFSFTSANRTTPPREITDLFYDIQALPAGELHSGAVRDVCLGFCYGPAAALGFQYSNQPCFALARGATQCGAASDR